MITSSNIYCFSIFQSICCWWFMSLYFQVRNKKELNIRYICINPQEHTSQFKIWLLVGRLKLSILWRRLTVLPNTKQRKYCNFGSKLSLYRIINKHRVFSGFYNTLSANPTKWSNKLKQLSIFVDELFECVWPFCEVGA